MKTNSRTSIVHDYDAVKAAIEGAASVSEVLKKLNLRAAGGNYRALKNACMAHGLALPTPDSEVFRKAQAKSMQAIRMPIRPDTEVFCENSDFTSRSSMKTRLRKVWPDWVCSECGLGEIWNGKQITLQLDHVNGVYNDNRMENLRLLCPNCHSQTETFAGRSQRGTSPTAGPQCACGASKSKYSKTCRSCGARRPGKKKIDWPPENILKQMVENLNYSGTGRELGVSANAVKRHLERLSVEPGGIEPLAAQISPISLKHHFYSEVSGQPRGSIR